MYFMHLQYSWRPEVDPLPDNFFFFGTEKRKTFWAPRAIEHRYTFRAALELVIGLYAGVCSYLHGKRRWYVSVTWDAGCIGIRKGSKVILIPFESQLSYIKVTSNSFSIGLYIQQTIWDWSCNICEVAYIVELRLGCRKKISSQKIGKHNEQLHTYILILNSGAKLKLQGQR